MNGLALCAGYGGPELGIEQVLDQYRTICYVEGESFAASHLVKKMEEGNLDQAPIWSNIKTFNGDHWSGKVDIITGGFPCQPYPNIVKFRLSEIVLDLDKLGYNVAWCVMEASRVGAPHRRKRWFLLGILNNTNPHDSIKRPNCRPIQQKNRNNVSGLGKKYHGSGFEYTWEIEPSMGRLVDGATNWVDKLRLLGNGVVPQQAAYAFQILGERLAAGIVEKRTPRD